MTQTARLFVGLLALALGATTAIAAPTPVAGAPTTVEPAAIDFVTIQYQDFLGRDPDAAGLEFWSDKIDNGEDAGSLIDSMVSAPEFAEVVAPLVRLYRAYFLRAPDYVGLSYWIEQSRDGSSLSRVSSVFANSSEFTQRYGKLNNSAFVELIYRNVLRRAPDDIGKAYWVNRLDNGASRGSVMLGFSESAEYTSDTFGQVRASMLYLGMLRRTPEAAGLAYWANAIDGGKRYGSVVRDFLASPEYQQRLVRLLQQQHPLTGEATANAFRRAALAIKVDNVPRARPQAGLEDADVVYEEMVEGNLTRLIAIFQSRAPEIVGPVRSVRTTDFAILSPLNRPLLAASGANKTVLRLLENHPIVNMNALVISDGYYRNSSRPAPHNLFTNPRSLWAQAPQADSPPPDIFHYRQANESLLPAARPTTGVDLDFGRTTVAYQWSTPRNGWARTQDGSRHLDASGDQLVADNVIVMQTNYNVSAADAESPEAETVGGGPAWVYTDQTVTDCFWSRSAATDPIEFTDSEGRRCPVAPGTTWIALAPAGAVSLR